ncbi:MAG: DNA polymerase III subunit chi [Thermodesulforhabdaceae bacterium]
MVIFFETTRKGKDRDLGELIESIVERFSRSVHVITSSTIEATRIDNLLWTFKKESFIPHVILGPGESTEERLEKVFITVGLTVLQNCDVVIPLDVDQGEDIFLSYKDGIVIVLGDDQDQKERARELWRRLARLNVPRHHVFSRDKNSWLELLNHVWEKA